MYFVTQSDKKDQKFRKYAAFFIEKYPLAFGGEVTYLVGEGKDRREAPEDRWTKLESVTGVKYEFEDSEHAKAFENFETKVGECFRLKDGAAEALLRMILETRELIPELQTSAKHVDCTIQRFYLLLMPLLAMVEESSYAAAKELASEFTRILLEAGFSLSIKINALVQLHNTVGKRSGLKAYAVEQLVSLCASESCLEIMVNKARSVVADSKDRDLTPEERRSLYKTVAQALDKHNDFS